MALPSSIPTSFVPQPSSGGDRQSSNAALGLVAYLAYIILAVMFVVAIGVFAYGKLLTSAKLNKDTQLATAAKAIDPSTVTNFVRLQHRLDAATTLLNSHVAVSGFFTVIEEVMPTTLRFSALHIGVDSSGNPTFDGTGIAKSFNALANASTDFADDPRIKGAIFSGIALNKDGTASFSLKGGLDPKVIAYPATTP